jgi:hypothetical protein
VTPDCFLIAGEREAYVSPLSGDGSDKAEYCPHAREDARFSEFRERGTSNAVRHSAPATALSIRQNGRRRQAVVINY